jgi:diguanylate cyclase (GGDEF)-like protein/PAS domain S-box-containing protein
MMSSERAEDGTGRQGDRASARAVASLALLDALLDVAGDAPPFARLFAAARSVFAYDQALVLRGKGDVLRCVAGDPDPAGDRQWPASPALAQAARSRVLALAAGEPSDDRALVPPDLVAADQAALLIPIAAEGRHAALLLRRAAGAPDFAADLVVGARQCAIIGLAALAMRNGEKLGREVDRLGGLIDELRAGETRAAEDRELYRALIDLLPISLTVQDEDGRFILVNAVAATNLAMTAQELVDSSPADFLPPEEAAQRREWEIGLMQSGAPLTTEDRFADPAGERTWLTTRKPVHILDRQLLMSSSLDISDRKRMEDELARRAYFDDLTGLPNRTLIEQRVEDAIRRDEDARRFAVAFIDLDNFKHINDYYSHAIGDALLKSVTERINRRLRDSDMLARISGDEFLLLIDPVVDDEQIRVLVEHLLADLKQPFHLEAFEIFTSASLGLSTYPEHGRSYEALRRNADNAMYRAKHATKGGAVYFDASMGEAITARMELEQRLRLAIRDRKFCCAFQPKVDVHTQEVVGFETLVRWRDEDGEIQPPSAFVGLAIELGLIDPITHFVVDEAVRSIEQLDAAFGAGTTLSINVAAKQAGDLEFMRSLLATIDASRYARRIMLELTEDAFVAKNRFQLEVLPMIRELGVRVSIDDFGTGYSSLSVLADITADELKVDRSFITAIHQRPRSQSVLRTIESLGHALGMTIVAEGIETFEELAYLQAATRIRQAQGFYFSKPFFLDDLQHVCHVDPEVRDIAPARPRAAGRDLQSARIAAARSDHG